MKKRAKFIVLEGGEGSGKTSLLLALKEALGDSILTTREPGGSPYAEVIRDAALKHPLAGKALPETMLCLMFASRFDHVNSKILPALEAGIPVITDRFDGSSFAYNVWAQSEGRLSDVFWNLRKQLAIAPDLYIYIDVPVEEGLRRAHSRNQTLLDGNHFDDREAFFHKKVREGYLEFFKEKSVRSAIIDGAQSLEKVKKDFADILQREL